MSWFVFFPNYVLTMAVDINILAFFWVLIMSGQAKGSDLEDYVYDSMGSSCIIEDYKCP